jgi:hypothetical protein
MPLILNEWAAFFLVIGQIAINIQFHHNLSAEGQAGRFSHW